MKLSPVHRLIAAVAERVDRRIGWHRLPVWLGILVLVGIRDRLRERNLVDTGVPDRSGPPDPRWLVARSDDGSFNDLTNPGMGAVGAPAGRNVPLAYAYAEPEPKIMTPSPRHISRALLTRDALIPVPSANVLLAAWLQFEVHDWFNHGINPREGGWQVPLTPDDSWPPPMVVERTKSDPAWRADSGLPTTYVTEDSHWWDGSQIYGNTTEAVLARRGENGTLRVDPDGLTPADLQASANLSGVAGNMWVGLEVLHTLFTLEHNAIVAMLHRTHPELGDDATFDKARLINAALMAKIHTVEWTPAVIAHPTTKKAMRINWWGLTGERLTRRFGRMTPGEIPSGIPGTPAEQHGVPYSITEEFIAVYRMHQLMPDDFTFRSARNDELIAELAFPDLGALQSRARLADLGVANTFYSLGREHPGLVCLHNFPRHLQHFAKPDGTTVDLATIDLLRVRERGVPRYNQLRELVHLPRVRSFSELTDNPTWAREMAEVYDGNIDDVDLLVGTYAERMPRGFAFSDTAFRIFVLMASRRLKSDRFFTDDYKPGTYTREGLDWVENTTMSSVLLRHYPELAPALRGVDNAFSPWNRVTRS